VLILPEVGAVVWVRDVATFRHYTLITHFALEIPTILACFCWEMCDLANLTQFRKMKKHHGFRRRVSALKGPWHARGQGFKSPIRAAEHCKTRPAGYSLHQWANASAGMARSIIGNWKSGCEAMAAKPGSCANGMTSTGPIR
jgi:hypothetical protein